MKFISLGDNGFIVGFWWAMPTLLNEHRALKSISGLKPKPVETGYSKTHNPNFDCHSEKIFRFFTVVQNDTMVNCHFESNEESRRYLDSLLSLRMTFQITPNP